MIRLSEINIFPIKSMAGISVTSSDVESQGLKYDRRLMLVDGSGKFITARKYPRLLHISCRLVVDGIELTLPNGQALMVNYSEFTQPIVTTIWRDTVSAFTGMTLANQWLSQFLGIEVKICYLDQSCRRYRQKIENEVSFADGYPLLLIGQASLTELNDRASEPTAMAQFRTNLVIDGADAFAEDHWQRIAIGAVEFELVKPCERCIMTTVDPTNAKFRTNKEPLATLATFRADNRGRLMFGENLIAQNLGVIKVGDPVRILSRRQGICYGKKLINH